MQESVEKQVVPVIISDSNLRRVFLVGDSTVSPFNNEIFIPRAGYGTAMQDFLSPDKAEAINLALSGRSSKSFLQEENYALLHKNLKKDDFLIIAFGHNDEKYEEARYTNASAGIDDTTSFQYYLFHYYVALARKCGAVPVLCTPIVRRSPDGIYMGTHVHITKDNGMFCGGDYPEAIRKLGKKEHFIVVDNTTMTKKLYTELGVRGSRELHAQVTENPDTIDNSHLNRTGAVRICSIVVDEIKRQSTDFASLLLR